ncbi:MAG: hypothetical protein E8D43_00890 [Nitrospira sp.]|nr:MAG: hypothetical protein E8D43_00890 [Nitrospira sp.]
MKVYLAGPIYNMTVGEANDWRTETAAVLRAHGITGISPLRCEPPGVDGIYQGPYDDPKFGHLKAIASKNVFDTKMADVVLCYMPKSLNPTWPSVGTLAELFMAFSWGKPVILVTDEPRLLEHPLVRHAAGWVLPTLDDAVELLTGLLVDYVEA